MEASFAVCFAVVGSALERDRIHAPHEVRALHLQLVDVPALDRHREEEARMTARAVDPAGIDARDALLAPLETERDRRHHAPLEIGAHGGRSVDAFKSHGLRSAVRQYAAHLCSSQEATWDGASRAGA